MLVWFLGSCDHDVKVDPPKYYEEELNKKRLFTLTTGHLASGHCTEERKEGDSHICTRTSNNDSTIMFITL